MISQHKNEVQSNIFNMTEMDSSQTFAKIKTKYLTFISDQQRNKICLFLGENFGEVLQVSNTSASQKVQKFLIAVRWLPDVNKVFSL